MKTGSDVCHELFEILPRLAPGVLIHFHDIFWPFEYSEAWGIENNLSWNELYGLRAFLMYNDNFEIVFFNDFFRRWRRNLIQETYPKFLHNTGGALWLRKRGETYGRKLVGNSRALSGAVGRQGSNGTSDPTPSSARMPEASLNFSRLTSGVSEFSTRLSEI